MRLDPETEARILATDGVVVRTGSSVALPAGPMTERVFMQSIIDLAKREGWRHYHTHDSRRSPSGFPDLVLVKPPRIIAAEVKTETGQVTADQQNWLDDLGLTPVETFIWRPSYWAGIVAALKGKQ